MRSTVQRKHKLQAETGELIHGCTYKYCCTVFHPKLLMIFQSVDSAESVTRLFLTTRIMNRSQSLRTKGVRRLSLLCPMNTEVHEDHHNFIFEELQEAFCSRSTTMRNIHEKYFQS